MRDERLRNREKGVDDIHVICNAMQSITRLVRMITLTSSIPEEVVCWLSFFLCLYFRSAEEDSIDSEWMDGCKVEVK